MNLSDPKHPIWPILYQTVPATVILILCMTLYKSGLVPKDLFLPIGNSLALLIVYLLKKQMTD
jgi:hypothetical protein